MAVVDLQTGDRHVGDPGGFRVRGELCLTGSGESAVAEGEVRSGHDRREEFKGNLVQFEYGVCPGKRFGQKVGPAVYNPAPGAEDVGFQVEGGRVYLVRQADVADVRRPQIDAAQLQ